MTKEITVLPPKIKQYFNTALLTTPHKMREDSETLWKTWLYIEKLWYKLDKCPGKRSKCEQLKRQFLELYERTKAKEEERKTTPKHRTQMPFYFIRSIGRKGDRAFDRAKYGKRFHDNSRFSRRYGKIYKVQTSYNGLGQYGKACVISEST